MKKDKLKLEPGNQVTLKSGGPTMTVNSKTKKGKVSCVWFEVRSAAFPVSKSTQNLHEGEFKIEALIRTPTDEPPTPTEDRRDEVIQEIRDAIQNKDVTLHYQQTKDLCLHIQGILRRYDDAHS